MKLKGSQLFFVCIVSTILSYSFGAIAKSVNRFSTPEKSSEQSSKKMMRRVVAKS